MTNKTTTSSIIKHFSPITDPRMDRRKQHHLKDIFFITLCASICGADSWVAIETFGKAKEAWFTKRQEPFGQALACLQGETHGYVESQKGRSRLDKL